MQRHKSTLLINSNIIPSEALGYLNLTPLCDWSYLRQSSNDSCTFDMLHQENILNKADLEIDFNYKNYINVLNSNIVSLCNNISTFEINNAKLEIDLFNASQDYQALINQCTIYAQKLNIMQMSLNSYESALNQQLPNYIKTKNESLTLSNSILGIKKQILSEFTHIVLFKNCDFTGQRLELPIGRYEKLSFGNIAIIPPNLKMTTYVGSNFQGLSTNIIDCTCMSGIYNSAVIEPVDI